MSRQLNQHANAEVRISVTSPSSTDSRDDGYVNLRVEDAVSGTVLVDVDMEAGRWWRLMQSSTQSHPAFVSRHLDRIGKRMEHASVNLGRVKGQGEAEAAWHETEPPAGWEAGPDTLEFRSTNQGWVAILRRWVTP